MFALSIGRYGILPCRFVIFPLLVHMPPLRHAVEVTQRQIKTEEAGMRQLQNGANDEFVSQKAERRSAMEVLEGKNCKNPLT